MTTRNLTANSNDPTQRPGTKGSKSSESPSPRSILPKGEPLRRRTRNLVDVVTNRATGETAQPVRITCPDHGLLELSTWKPSEAVAFAHSHDEGHGDRIHHAVIEWIADGPWEADPHDVD